jgi:glycine/D-amino acid oxidase-like deaminating enzyme
MERVRILDPAPDRSTIELTHRRALDLLPALRDTKITAAWAGYIDSTPDGVPAIGEVSSLPGLILAAGFSGHGFGIGPGSGHLVADIVTGAAPIVDPKPYRPDRFAGFAVGKVSDF